MIELLSNTGYIVVNKIMIKKLGIHEALILGELCSEYSYWKKENKLDSDGYFYSTRENIEENTGLTPYQQRTAIRILVNKKIITEVQKGMPLRNWYKLNIDILNKLFIYDTEDISISSSKETSHQDVKKLNNKELKNLTTSSEETLQHDVKKLNTNNNNIIINNNNNLSILSEDGKIGGYEEVFKSNIEYDILKQDNYIKNELEDITAIVVDILNSNKEAISINGEFKDTNLIKNKLLKLKAENIEYVIRNIKANRSNVRNIKAYILTALYNSLITMNIDTTLNVGRILNGGFTNE